MNLCKTTVIERCINTAVEITGPVIIVFALKCTLIL